ncbi:unnamed protein product [Lactuca virosa]|uniref:Uncharacterized protein n=1 Tax=Lactuca virosa TaxID=75947 RepID=A0AAU9PC41_9ASTR|nr:unnamed protein product [Lactuca virosa]
MSKRLRSTSSSSKVHIYVIGVQVYVGSRRRKFKSTSETIATTTAQRRLHHLRHWSSYLRQELRWRCLVVRSMSLVVVWMVRQKGASPVNRVIRQAEVVRHVDVYIDHDNEPIFEWIEKKEPDSEELEYSEEDVDSVLEDDENCEHE